MMTNREELIAELAELSNADLYAALSDCRTTLVMEIQQCEDCKALYGPCPCADDDDAPCRIGTEDWMDLPCRAERLITKEALTR